MTRLLLVLLSLILALISCGAPSDQDGGERAALDDDVDDDDNAPPIGHEFERCPDRPEMMLVPAGWFVFRYDGPRFEAEGLADHDVDLAAYCIDEFEYPNQAGVEPTPLSWDQAEATCAAQGKRLCTGEEWQKACAGPEGGLFTWGDEWNDQVCNTHTDDFQARELAPSGSWPNCRSYYGVYDMGGNVSEWTAEIWQEGWSDMTVRGGGYNLNQFNMQELQPDGFWQFTGYSQRCSSIHHHEPDVLMLDDGARCCADL